MGDLKKIFGALGDMEVILGDKDQANLLFSQYNQVLEKTRQMTRESRYSLAKDLLQLMFVGESPGIDTSIVKALPDNQKVGLLLQMLSDEKKAKVSIAE